MLAFKTTWVRMDRNGDGLLQREEFEAEELVKREGHLRRHLYGMYDAADVDGSGAVSMAELARVSFPKATAGQLRDILALVRWKPEKQKEVAKLLQREYSAETRRSLVELFRSYDADGSGVITRSEILEGLKGMVQVFSVGEQNVLTDRKSGGGGEENGGGSGEGWDGSDTRSAAAADGRPRTSGRGSRSLGLFSLVEADLQLMVQAANEDCEESHGQQEQQDGSGAGDTGGKKGSAKGAVREVGIDLEAFVRMMGPALEPDAPLAEDQELAMSKLRELQERAERVRARAGGAHTGEQEGSSGASGRRASVRRRSPRSRKRALALAARRNSLSVARRVQS